MSHDHAPAVEHKPHVLPVRIYVLVWGGLIVLTWITVAVSYFHFGFLNIAIAMAIATAKAALVTLFFMHLKYDEKFNQVLFAGTLVFFFVFIMLTLSDNAERGRVDPIERAGIELVPARTAAGSGAADTTHGGAGADTTGGAHGTAPAPSPRGPAEGAHPDTTAPGAGGH